MHIDEFLTYHGVVRASGMYATYGIYNLEAIIRKQTFGFIGKLRKSCNTIVQTFENELRTQNSELRSLFNIKYEELAT